MLPTAVARPINDTDVRNAVRWTTAHDMPVRARSGGHSYAGYSTLSGGLVLDLRKLTRSGRQAGRHGDHRRRRQLIDVYAGLAKAGADPPGGSCPSVGVSGSPSGVGSGWRDGTSV